LLNSCVSDHNDLHENYLISELGHRFSCGCRFMGREKDNKL